MTNNSFSEKRKSQSKGLIINHKKLLREYAVRNSELYGLGIIVVNLLLLGTEKIEDLNLLNTDLNQLSKATVHRPVAYIPQSNFWFKMINLKIQKKHKIDLRDKIKNDEICVVFIKDDAIEYFSIYTIKNRKTSPSLTD